MLKQFLIRWLGNGLSLWLAAELIPGVSYGNNLWVIVTASLIFSIVNAFVRPVVIILSLPAIILSLGLFTLIVNSFMLYLVTLIYPPLQIATFGAAILAVMVVWLVNYALNSLLKRG